MGILQWTYRNGRDWGTCNGACGEVETFKACADIEIVRPDNTTDTTTELTTEPVTEGTTDSGTTKDSTTEESGTTVSDGECRATGAWLGQSEMDEWCELNCHNEQPFCPPDICTCGPPQLTSCTGVGVWSSSLAVGSWCENNCLRHSVSFCPSTLCNCS